MKKRGILFALFLSAALAVFGQSAREMDLLLEDPGVSFARAARYVLPAAGLLSEDAKEADAFRAALEKGWIPAEAASEAPIRLDQFAHLLMMAFSLKGGFGCAVFPGPRYAYREMLHRGYIQGRSDPAQKVPGSRLVRILGRVLDAREAGEAQS